MVLDWNSRRGVNPRCETGYLVFQMTDPAVALLIGLWSPKKSKLSESLGSSKYQYVIEGNLTMSEIQEAPSIRY